MTNGIKLEALKLVKFVKITITNTAILAKFSTSMESSSVKNVFLPKSLSKNAKPATEKSKKMPQLPLVSTVRKTIILNALFLS